MVLTLVLAFLGSYNWIMNAEHQALAEYLEGRLTAHMDRRFIETRDEFKAEFKEVHRRINSQIIASQK